MSTHYQCYTLGLCSKLLQCRLFIFSATSVFIKSPFLPTDVLCMTWKTFFVNYLSVILTLSLIELLRFCAIYTNLGIILAILFECLLFAVYFSVMPHDAAAQRVFLNKFLLLFYLQCVYPISVLYLVFLCYYVYLHYCISFNCVYRVGQKK